MQRPVREILVALPGLPPDLYRMHQCVWEHAMRAVKPGTRPTFLYRVEDGIVRIRSQDFTRGTVREFRAGSCRLDIAAVIQSVNGDERPVPRGDLEDWVEKKLGHSGFRTKGLEISSFDLQEGCKCEKATGRLHRIVLPVARIRLDLEVEQPELSSKAWRDGIGRGRRFGLGMLFQ